MANHILSVIKRPLITEKNTTHLQANIYAFEVDATADKGAIKKAIEKAFDVEVVGVKTMKCRGRVKRMGRFMSKVPYYKKALVQLAEGQKIKIFEGA